MDVWFGRNNLALTVFVPFDCKNNCPFCTSKEMYSTKGNARLSLASVRYQMKRVFDDYNYPIKDVVFTGGEPTWRLDDLAKLVDVVPSKYNVYINTTLPRDRGPKFLSFVNDTKKIKGINVSRHCASYEEDSEFLNDVAPDELMERFQKPVRINCVVNGRESPDIITPVIERWSIRQNVELCFRRDYTKITPEELHNPYEPFMVHLSEMGFQFSGHTQCNVCDTTRFERDGFTVIYHKGLEHSSIYHLDSASLEVNDLIILPDGRLTYDWSETRTAWLLEMEGQFRRFGRRCVPEEQRRIIDDRFNGCGSSSGGCGGLWWPSLFGGCGGGGHGCGGGRGC